MSRKLENLDEWNLERNAIANQYNEAFSEINRFVIPETFNKNYHVWHLYVLRVNNRKRFMEEALKNGIETSIHYPLEINRQKAYKNHFQHNIKFKNANKFVSNLVSLPIFPKMKTMEIKKVIDVVSKL